MYYVISTDNDGTLHVDACEDLAGVEACPTVIKHYKSGWGRALHLIEGQKRYSTGEGLAWEETLRLLRQGDPPPSACVFNDRVLEAVAELVAAEDGAPDEDMDEVPVTDGFVADLNAVDRFHRLVDWLARRIFGVDVDHCRNVVTSVYPRSRYQIDHSVRVPRADTDPTAHRQAVLSNAEVAFRDLRLLVADIDR